MTHEMIGRKGDNRMFNYRNKRENLKRYRGDIIYITKSNDIDVEKLLDIIVRNIEGYVRQEGKIPEKINLSYENYNRILEHNKSLIEVRNGKYYTFGVEIEV